MYHKMFRFFNKFTLLKCIYLEPFKQYTSNPEEFLNHFATVNAEVVTVVIAFTLP